MSLSKNGKLFLQNVQLKIQVTDLNVLQQIHEKQVN